MKYPGKLLAGLALAAVLCAACEPPRSEVSSGRDFPYPTCNGRVPGEGTVLAAGRIRSGPFSRAHDIVETFEVRRRDCLHVATAHQEWPGGITDTEVVYDHAWKPLRAWRRTAIPGTEDGRPEIRRYDLRQLPVAMKRLEADGTMRRYTVRGQTPDVVVGTGRGLIIPWILRERLSVGGVARGRVLDIREDIERIQDGALRRDPDRDDPDLGRVRVYTFYGRESIFTDDHDVVVGDLAGMRVDRVLTSPAPPALPTYGTLDPVNTP